MGLWLGSVICSCPKAGSGRNHSPEEAGTLPEGEWEKCARTDGLCVCWGARGLVGVIEHGISPEERAAWHPDVWVRFQKKAWADEAMCEDYALVEMAEITAAARLAGRESVAIFDNLHGQTTQTHLVHLARNRCKRHRVKIPISEASNEKEFLNSHQLLPVNLDNLCYTT